MNQLPLEGVRVADFSWVVAGPHCTEWLAVMGADVIRIESELHTDVNRRLPPFAEGVAGTNRSGLWHGLNFSKRSCSLNLTKPKAVEIAKRIVLLSDVVIENFSYGMMERFGLGYEAVRQLKPDLIFASSSGFGRTGPYRKYVTWGPPLVAFTGLASLTGYPGGPPERMVGGIWADHLTGLYLFYNIMAALHHRANTGLGQFLDVSMAEAVIAQIPEGIMDYTMNRRVRGRLGNRDEVLAPHNSYRCQGEDRWVAIVVSNDEEWQALCEAMGDPDWARDDRFADAYRRRQNQDELDRLIGDWTKSRTNFEVAEILQRAGVPAAPAVNIEELAHDAHLHQRGFYVRPPHPEVGERQLAGVPFKLGACPEPDVRPAPLLGQDNSHVFCDLLGMTVAEIAQLVAEQVIC